MWKFVVTAGQMFRPDGSLLGPCYSGGDLGTRPDAINNPADEGLKNVGPLPAGTYTFGCLVHNSHLGPVAIRLDPVPDENGSLAWMMKRGGFYVHMGLRSDVVGDIRREAASEGCIVGLSEPAIMEMWNSADHRLQVVNEEPQ